MKPFSINFNHMEVYEAGALLSVVLAYPDIDEEKRGKYFNHLASPALQLRFANDPSAATQPQWIKPIYAFDNAAKGSFGAFRFETRMNHWIAIGHLAVPFLLQQETGEIRLHPCTNKLTLESSIEELFPDVGLDSVKHRQWGPTMPVLHLATTLCVQLQPLAYAGKLPGWPEFMVDRDALASWIRVAELHEPLVAKAFPHVAGRQIKVRLA